MDYGYFYLTTAMDLGQGHKANRSRSRIPNLGDVHFKANTLLFYSIPPNYFRLNFEGKVSKRILTKMSKPDLH